MFVNKKIIQLQKENLELKRRLSEFQDKTQQDENNLNVFVDSFYRDLTTTIKQHEMVNRQHHILGELVSKIKNRFDNVHTLSQKSSNKSIKLHEKGKVLLQSMIDIRIPGKYKHNR